MPASVRRTAQRFAPVRSALTFLLLVALLMICVPFIAAAAPSDFTVVETSKLSGAGQTLHPAAAQTTPLASEQPSSPAVAPTDLQPPEPLSSPAAAQSNPPPGANRSSGGPSLTHIARVPHPHGYGLDFVRRGNLLFATKWESSRKLDVIDLANPAAPKLLTDIVLPRYRSDGICLWDDLALVNVSGMIIPVDVSDPSKPKPLESQMWSPDPDQLSQMHHYELAVQGHRLFVGTGLADRLVRIYELRRPFAPQLVGTLDVSGKLSAAATARLTLHSNGGLPTVRHLIFDGDRLHVGCAAGVFGADISDPSRPRLTYAYLPDCYVESIAVDGRRLFVATSNRGTPDPRQPDRRDQPTLSPLGIVELDLSHPDDLRPLAAYRDIDLPDCLLIHHGVLYVAGRMRTPSSLISLGGAEVPRDLAEAYLSQRLVLHALDVAAPGTIRRLSSIDFPPQYRAHPQMAILGCRRMAADGDSLVVADHAFGIRTINIADPVHIQSAGRLCTVIGETDGVLVRGRQALLCGFARMLPIDLPADAAPRCDLGGAIPFPIMFQNRAIADDDASLLATPLWNRQSLMLFDVSDLGRPKLAGFQPWPKQSEIRAVASGGDCICLLIASIDGRELHLFTVAPPRGSMPVQILGRVRLGRFPESIPWWGTTLFAVSRGRAVAALRKGAKGEQVSLIAVELSDPAHPRLASETEVSGIQPGAWRPSGVFFDDRCAYLPGGATGVPTLSLVDISQSGGRVLGAVSERSPTRYADAMLLADRRLVLVQDYHRGLRLVDVSEPQRPRIVWTETPSPPEDPYTTIGWTVGTLAGDRLYAPRLDHLDIFQITP